MTQKTNLNVTPYYDDFVEGDNYHRVLFRPGFAVQARELTQLQTILQKQIQRFGDHIFKEGSIVIPGNIGYDNEYNAVKLQSTFSSVAISTYLSTYVGSTITGATSGVKAKVIGYAASTSTDPDTLFVKYISTSTVDNATETFSVNENISSSIAVGSYSADAASATAAETGATAQGSALSVQEGIYYIRGNFVQCSTETLVLDKYTNTPSYRVGFTVTETLVTPESSSGLLDNATGATNYAAKGAHRLQITLALAKFTLTATNDANFVELFRVDNGIVQVIAETTEYSIIEKMIARRTYDESGNYVVTDFSFNLREHLSDGSNNGLYTSAAGGDNTKLALIMGAGKAYIQGHEVHTRTPSVVNINKARTTKTVNNDYVPFNLGNYAKVTKIHGSPDITNVGSTQDPFKKILIYDTVTATRGVAAGAIVGQARSRAFEYYSGTAGATAGNATAIYHHYLFDLQMMTNITMSGAVTLAVDSVVTGTTSGATGVLYAAVGSATALQLMEVAGTFVTGEAITGTGTGASTGGVTISAVVTKDFSKDAKQLFMAYTSISGGDYTGDVKLTKTFTLSGTYRTETSGTDNLIGVSGYSTAEVQVGDVLTIPTGVAGATEERTVDALTATAISFSAAPTTDAITTADVVRNRAEVQEQEETVMVMKMPKEPIKTLLTSAGATDTTYTVRRQFQGTTNGSSAVTFTATTGEAFVAHAEKDYSLEILTAGGGGPSGAQSDLVTAATGFVLSGSPSGNTLTITNSAVLGTSAVVKLTATLSVGTKSHKTKTANKTQTLTVNDDGTTGGYNSLTYGHRVIDKEISLGISDAYSVHAVFESPAIATVPVLPELTMTTSGVGFTRGESITGSSSGATGIVIVNSGTSLKYIKKAGTFTTSDSITGVSSAKTDAISVIAQVGDTNIVSRYLLDTGQRDSFYDISRLVRKPDQVTPSGQLSIIYSNFSHGTGDYFSVDSYGDIAFGDIPYYQSNKVDPETQSPTGIYPLHSCLDFRSTVANIAASGTTEPFSFNNRTFEGSGSSAADIVKVDDTVRVDYDYYLSRADLLYLTDVGQFQYIEGAPDESPRHPSSILPNAMLFGKFNVGPFTFGSKDVIFQKVTNKRYTMKDISMLENRIKNVEFYTALGMLETDTQTFQIQDANGLDRFKSGFIVDNFAGHRVADVDHPDNDVAIGLGVLRPRVFTDNLQLIEENTTDAERTADGYQKTGNIFTLPYTHTAFITQSKASRTEFINPFNVVIWLGDLELSPTTDTWRSNKNVGINPVNSNVMGNYDQMVQDKEDGMYDTIWGDWFIISDNSTQGDGWQGMQWTGSGSRDKNNPGENPGSWQHGNWHTSTTDIWRKRTGTEQFVDSVVETGVSVGDFGNVGTSLIPNMRSREITFTAVNMKPLTRMYAFFDKVDVNSYSKPTGTYAGSTLLNGAVTKVLTTITVDSTTGFPTTGTILIGSEQMTYTGITATTFTGVTRNSNAALTEPDEHADNLAVSGSVNSMPLITDVNGAVTGIFTIPTTEALFFQAGTKEFRLTDNATDSRIFGNITSSASADYSAQGHFDHIQETLHNITQGQIRQETVFGDPEHLTGSGRNWEHRHVGDPLAQSFLVSEESGTFITKVDIYFSEKDDTLPVTLDIRTVQNGYPTLISLGGSSVTKNAADVSVDAIGTANTATTFTFDHPLFCDPDKEYAIVLRSNSQAYKVWISQVGEAEVGGTSAISTQPSLGSLFKAQRATTWTANQLQDLKFILYRAQFDTTAAGLVTIVNEELTATSSDLSAPGIKTLPENPIRTANGDATVKINFKNHGHHSTTDNVIISGVKSDVVSTLTNGALTNSATTVVVDSQALFPAAGTIKIDDEIITYTGKTSTTDLTGCTRGTNSTTAVTHEDNSVCELYMIAGISLINVNKTHTVISGIELDSFTIETGTNATSTLIGGGDAVTCTRNIPFDAMSARVDVFNYLNTSNTANARSTTGKSVSGSETPFVLRTLANQYPIGLNVPGEYNAPQIVCSQINETNESIGKSYRLTVGLSVNADPVTGSISNFVSPVMSSERMSLATLSYRTNKIATSSDIGALTDYADSKQADGDNNSAIYITDKVTLNLPATALRVYFAANVMPDADIEVMFKTLRTDGTEVFDDLGWTYFNTTGAPDTAVPKSKSQFGAMDFKEYEYSVDSLEQYISFAIKIVMKSTNSSYAPIIKQFRTIALAV